MPALTEARLSLDLGVPVLEQLVMARLLADPAEIDRILARGAERAREMAAPVLARTYEIVGLVR